MKRVWIFIHTSHIGGAEKRFAGLWQSLQDTEGIYNIVLRKGLHDKFLKDIELEHTLAEKRASVFFLDETDLKTAYRSFIKKNTTAGDVLHFIGEHPFLRTKNRKQVFSITQSSLKNMNLFGKLGQFAGIYFSDVADVLDPSIFKLMQRVFVFKRKAISRTSNSFCNIHQHNSVGFEKKKDWLVFLGRFENMKQVKQLLAAVPQVHKAIAPIATNDLRFYFLGHGSLEAELQEMVNQPHFKGIPITIDYTDRPNAILSRSKVFFSVQLHNNYPSRSLIEAMAAGNIPLVTDVGETRWLAKPEFSYYIPEHFTTQDVVNEINKIFKEDAKVLGRKSGMARQVVIEEHTIEKMREYYLSLYN